MICEFVPSIYSDQLSYTVTVDDNLQNRKTADAVLENGIAAVTLNAQDNCSYKVMLEISNGEESRSITISENVWVQGNCVTYSGN